MSVGILGCDLNSLTINDIIRMVTGIEDGVYFIRTLEGDIPRNELISCLECGSDLSALNILKGALSTNADGEYCLNVLPNPNGGNGNGFCAEFQVVYDSWTIKPTDADAIELNTMVEKMIADGVWALCDYLNIYSAHTNGTSEALTNWMNPGTNDATLHGTVLPAFTAFEGFTGNSAQSAYINSNYNPTAHGVNYTLNDASFGNYCRINSAVSTLEIGVADGANNSYLFNKNNTNNGAGRINDVATSSGAVASSAGLFNMIRTAANSKTLYYNKTTLWTTAVASTALPNFTFYLLGANNAGVLLLPSDRQLSMGFIGASFTTTQRDNFVDAFEAWMDHKGKGVIP